MDRRGCRRWRHAPARPWLRRGAGAAGAAGQASGNAGTGRAAAGSTRGSRSDHDPRTCSSADLAGCPEEEGQPGNQIIAGMKRGRSWITLAYLSV
ncbi:hypothetical protein [Paenibacillus sp. 7523-1]|uniref:hypothetical protein n=1 Tax=Paenibacillus sp. 7523-1 TaxID=2022550 RepID=UPI00159555DD|nr:hypothetical protein [Paenibacillus sp. 7523-1]